LADSSVVLRTVARALSEAGRGKRGDDVVGGELLFVNVNVEAQAAG